LQKKFPQKNLENFSKFYFLCIGIFFYNLGYNKKVIGLSALKLFRGENKSIKINPSDFRPNPKLKMAARGRFSLNLSILGHYGQIIFSPP
jgi:hypothetical protein